MRDFPSNLGKFRKPHFEAAITPRDFPTQSCLTSLELAHVSPDEFLRLERLGKRRRKPITLPKVTILK